MAGEIVAAIIGLVGAVVGGAISSGVTYLIARADRDKFVREKLWDERRISYTAMLNSLSACERAAAAIHGGFTDGPPGAGEDYHASPAYSRDCVNLAKQHAALVRAINSNQLVATKQMAGRVDRLTYDLAVARQENLIPPEDAERQWSLYREAEIDVMLIGKGELGVKEPEVSLDHNIYNALSLNSDGKVS